MKTKYERMNKEEKKRVFEIYKKEKPELAKKFKTMYLLSYIGVFYGSLLFLYDFFINKSKISYILDIVVCVFCLVSIFIVHKVKKKVLIDFVLNNKKRF